MKEAISSQSQDITLLSYKSRVCFPCKSSFLLQTQIQKIYSRQKRDQVLQTSRSWRRQTLVSFQWLFVRQYLPKTWRLLWWRIDVFPSKTLTVHLTSLLFVSWEILQWISNFWLDLSVIWWCRWLEKQGNQLENKVTCQMFWSADSQTNGLKKKTETKTTTWFSYFFFFFFNSKKQVFNATDEGFVSFVCGCHEEIPVWLSVGLYSEVVSLSLSIWISYCLCIQQTLIPFSCDILLLNVKWALITVFVSNALILYKGSFYSLCFSFNHMLGIQTALFNNSYQTSDETWDFPKFQPKKLPMGLGVHKKVKTLSLSLLLLLGLFSVIFFVRIVLYFCQHCLRLDLTYVISQGKETEDTERYW